VKANIAELDHISQITRRGNSMAKGPRGERRFADVNASAVMIAKIATGEIATGAIEGSRTTARTPPPWRWAAGVGGRVPEICRKNKELRSPRRQRGRADGRTHSHQVTS
jgi:hypothetical protein